MGGLVLVVFTCYCSSVVVLTLVVFAQAVPLAAVDEPAGLAGVADPRVCDRHPVQPAPEVGMAHGVEDGASHPVGLASGRQDEVGDRRNAVPAAATPVGAKTPGANPPPARAVAVGLDLQREE